MPKPFALVISRIPLFIFLLLFSASLLLREYYSFYISSDMAAQLQTLGNFMHGHGITFTVLDKANQLQHLKCSLWPAGFVLFLAPLYLLTKDVVLSAILLKIICYFFFVLFVSRYMNLLQISTAKKKGVLLFLCVSIAPFINFFPSDLLATTLCLWGFFYQLKYLQTDRLLYLTLALFFIALSFFVKYSFFPFLLYPALSFLLKERFAILKCFRQLLGIAFLSFAAFLITYFVNRLFVGRAASQSVYDAFHGMAHWNQLSRLDGFLFTVGYYELLLEGYLKSWSGFNFQFNWISLAATAYFYYLFVKTFFWNKSKPTTPAFQDSLNTSLSAGLLIVGFLSFLSINNPGQTWMQPYWTFVEETRYYGPVIIIGLINILVILMNARKPILGYSLLTVLVLLSLHAHMYVMNGFWKRDYQGYKRLERYMQTALVHEEKMPLVVYDPSTENTEAYYYLRSQGILLVSQEKYRGFKMDDTRFSIYALKNGTSGNESLIKVKP